MGLNWAHLPHAEAITAAGARASGDVATTVRNPMRGLGFPFFSEVSGLPPRAIARCPRFLVSALYRMLSD